MDLQIESRNIEMTPAWRTEIEERMDKLQAEHSELIHARVTLSKNPHHRNAPSVAEALIVVTLPVRHTITARKGEKTFEEAIRAAFASIDIELARYRDKRGTTEINEPPIALRGVICKLFPQEGYGFILQEGGGEVYFHRNAVHGVAFEDLEDGSEVAYNIEPGEQGLQATTVNPLGR